MHEPYYELLTCRNSLEVQQFLEHDESRQRNATSLRHYPIRKRYATIDQWILIHIMLRTYKIVFETISYRYNFDNKVFHTNSTQGVEMFLHIPSN